MMGEQITPVRALNGEKSPYRSSTLWGRVLVDTLLLLPFLRVRHGDGDEGSRGAEPLSAYLPFIRDWRKIARKVGLWKEFWY